MAPLALAPQLIEKAFAKFCGGFGAGREGAQGSFLSRTVSESACGPPPNVVFDAYPYKILYK